MGARLDVIKARRLAKDMAHAKIMKVKRDETVREELKWRWR